MRILLLLLAGLTLDPKAAPPSSQPTLRLVEMPGAQQPHFSLLTYNVLYSNRSDTTVSAILKADADVVCLQETNAAWDAKLKADLSARYPHVQSTVGDIYANGTMVFSKTPLHDVQRIAPVGGGWFGSDIVQIETPIGDVQIVNVHLRPMIADRGGAVVGFFTIDQIHERELQELHKKLKPGVPTIIAGDFNEGNNGRGTKWLQSQAMTDALPEFDRDTPTWHGEVFHVPATYRDDHVVYSADLHCFSAAVIREGASDHYPVKAVFGAASK